MGTKVNHPSLERLIRNKNKPYNAFMCKLQNQLSELVNYVFTVSDVLKTCSLEQFNLNELISEFNKISEFSNLEILENPYDKYILHIVQKGSTISPKYTKSIIYKFGKENYDLPKLNALIQKEEDLNFCICLKFTIERFVKKYKDVIHQETIDARFEFENIFFQYDDYAQNLKKSDSFRIDYNEYIRRFQGIDAYLATINDAFALFGLKLEKNKNTYNFVTVEKRFSSEPIYVIKNTPILGSDHMLGSINLDSLQTHADGSYGDHILRDPTSGRYYSTPVYDNYNENSEA